MVRLGQEMVRVVVTGIAGRMGRAIAEAIDAMDGIRFVAGTIRRGGNAAGLSDRLAMPVDDSLEAALDRGADAVIDFTTPEASMEHARICAARGAALVVGTTGFSPEQKAALTAAAGRIPIVLAPNMSVGVNLLFRLAAEAARTLGDAYDVEIVEAHHRHKKDAPSGTALRLAEVVAGALGRDFDDVACYGRRGITGPRPPQEIGIQTVRGGDVVGEHTLLFLGEGERVELVHRASSRGAFAAGAVRAAVWAVGRAPGLYDMQDVLFGERP